jgi:hypothetical protein
VSSLSALLCEKSDPRCEERKVSPFLLQVQDTLSPVTSFVVRKPEVSLFSCEDPCKDSLLFESPVLALTVAGALSLTTSFFFFNESCALPNTSVVAPLSVNSLLFSVKADVHNLVLRLDFEIHVLTGECEIALLVMLLHSCSCLLVRFLPRLFTVDLLDLLGE